MTKTNNKTVMDLLNLQLSVLNISRSLIVPDSLSKEEIENLRLETKIIAAKIKKIILEIEEVEWADFD
jgi:hypothetical protein